MNIAGTAAGLGGRAWVGAWAGLACTGTAHPYSAVNVVQTAAALRAGIRSD